MQWLADDGQGQNGSLIMDPKTPGRIMISRMSIMHTASQDDDKYNA